MISWPDILSKSSQIVRKIVLGVVVEYYLSKERPRAMLELSINILSLHPLTQAVAAFPWFCCYEFLQGSVASGSMHVHIGVVFRTRTARQILALLPLSSGCHAAGSETDARPSIHRLGMPSFLSLPTISSVHRQTSQSGLVPSSSPHRMISACSYLI